MGYVPKATLMGSNYNILDGTDSPSGPAGARFMSFGESAGAEHFNRALGALAENDEYLVAQMSHKSVYVLDPTGNGPGTDDQNCDYAGSSALQDAITAHSSDVVLFLRPGTYVLPTGADYVISGDNVHIVGVGGHGGTPPAVIQVDSGWDFTMSGDGCSVENVSVVASAPAANMGLNFIGDYFEGRMISTDGVRILLDGLSMVLENFTASPYDEVLRIGPSCQRVHVRNGTTLSPSNPSASVAIINFTTSVERVVIENFLAVVSASNIRGVSFSAGDMTEVTLRNVEVRVNDAEALYINSDMSGCVFDNCFFSCDVGVACDLSSAADVTGAEFNNCRFESEESLLLTDLVTPRELGMTFNNCHFENVSANWHNAVVVWVNGKRHGVATEDIGGRVPTFNNCTFKDTKAKGADVGVDPGTAGTPSSVFAPFRFEGCRCTNLTIDRSDIAYVIFDAAHLWLSRCDVDGLRFDFGTTGLMQPWLWATATQGVIQIADGSVVKDIVVGDKFTRENISGITTWQAPLIYAVGGDYSSGSADIKGRTVIDGVRVRSTISTVAARDWTVKDSVSDALVLQAADDVTIRRFEWAYENLIGQMDGYTNDTPLVLLGSRCIFEEGLIAIAESNDLGIPVVIQVGGGSTVRKSRIFLTPGSGTSAWRRLIDVVGRNAFIEGNHVVLNGDTKASSYHLINLLAHAFMVVNGNYFGAEDAVASSYIVVDSPDADSTFNGNILQSTSNGPPGVTGSGYIPSPITDTNLLIDDSTSLQA